MSEHDNVFFHVHLDHMQLKSWLCDNFWVGEFGCKIELRKNLS